ncbi:alpha/beta hydrolase family protein [Polymorphum gilvum]|uniref:BAAT/Acyl-CoA thioester hydrolase n=1 Tax=Polymorphum gilvum (strain LMG 25793 / CGMCC 1.9160 / SL003B-26A1) TaxID=991905 RepID=F2IYM8_POLGS|nr:alpha/beta hydrolase [Polymorphum gilvum]ADZ69475.1 BAAT/Acyl-CoA thioester hydrolase [Polymorphum gilvum SL003B-26A1]
MAETENRLEAVAGHWLPRMEVAGIASATARAIMAEAGAWANWCRAWTAAGDRHLALAEEAEAKGRRVTAGDGYARAALLYHFAQFMFFDDPDQKASANARKLAAFRRAAPLLDPPADLVAIPFEGGHLRASLRRPAGQEPVDAVILVPGSDSTKEEFPALEAHFLKRGLATLSLDGPGQGEGRAFGPLRADIGGAVSAAAAFLRGQPGLSGRLGLMGMAFGGNLALRAATAVPDLAGVVSVNGFHDLAAMWPTFPQVYRDNMRFALGATSAEAAFEAAAAFTLAGVPAPECPVLVLHGARDTIFPPVEAQRQVDWAGARSELHVFPEGNHVCNNIAWLYRPLVADWLAERLRSG